MKTQLILLSLLFPLALSAQERTPKELEKHAEKVKKSKDKSKNLVSLDTLFASGKPYCLMIGSKKFLSSYGAYSVRPLGNPATEEIYIESEIVGSGSTAIHYWNIIFTNQAQKIRINKTEIDLENTIVDYDLFNNTGLNVANVTKLVLLKGGSSAAPATTTDKNKLVDRNRNGAVIVSGAAIKQSGTIIGNIKKEDKAENGAVITHYTITLPNAELIATAKNTGIGDYNWQIIVAKDNTTHTVNSSIGKSEEDIAKYLVEHLYL